MNVEPVTCGPSPVHKRFTFVLIPLCLCFRCNMGFACRSRLCCFPRVAVDEAFEMVNGRRFRFLRSLNGDTAKIALVTLRRQRHRTTAVANHANQGPALGPGVDSLDQRNSIWWIRKGNNVFNNFVAVKNNFRPCVRTLLNSETPERGGSVKCSLNIY